MAYKLAYVIFFVVLLQRSGYLTWWFTAKGKIFCRFVPNYLRMSVFCCNFASKIAKDTKMVSTQPTFNQVYDLAAMLTWQDQRKLVQKVQHNIRQYAEVSPITKDELLARIDHADAFIDEGHYMEHEAAKQHFQSRKAQKAALL